ncbi:MAG TPA: ATP-grasp domain-containing protein [Candidatus Methanoperedens sp.]
MEGTRKVLITNASHISLAAARSLGRKGIEVTAVSPYRRSITFYSRYCRHRIVTSERPENDGYIDELAKIVTHDKFDMLLPGGSDLIYKISKYRYKLIPYTKIPIADMESIGITEDKSKTIKFALKLGIPCPRTFFSEDIDPSNMEEIAEEIGFPAVIKPDISSGARGISYAGSLKELEDLYEKTSKKYGSCHIQEFIRGKKYSGSALFNRDGLPRRVCVQQSLRQLPFTGGVSIYAVTEKQPQILRYSLELLNALNWYGVATVQFIVDDKDKRPKLLEINPRLYGSLCLAIAAGVDYPYLLYRLAIEGDIEQDLNYKTGIKSRYVFPKEYEYFLSILRNKSAGFSRNLSPSRAFLDFILFYEPKMNYFVMSSDDPVPAMANSVNYVRKKFKRFIKVYHARKRKSSDYKRRAC